VIYRVNDETEARRKFALRPISLKTVSKNFGDFASTVERSGGREHRSWHGADYQSTPVGSLLLDGQVGQKARQRAGLPELQSNTSMLSGPSADRAFHLLSGPGTGLSGHCSSAPRLLLSEVTTGKLHHKLGHGHSPGAC
jgi:hypothetical protein